MVAADEVVTVEVVVVVEAALVVVAVEMAALVVVVVLLLLALRANGRCGGLVAGKVLDGEGDDTENCGGVEIDGKEVEGGGVLYADWETAVVVVLVPVTVVDEEEEAEAEEEEGDEYCVNARRRASAAA